MAWLLSDYLEDPEKPEWNNIDNINRYQERYERPMDYYDSGTLGMKYMGGECYDDNEEDFVSHIDGSVISRREWIDLPPTQKPSSCDERACSVPQKEVMLQKEHFALQNQYREKDAGNLQHMKAMNGRQLTCDVEEPQEQEGLQHMYPAYQQTYYKNWSSRYPQNSGPGRVYINPREHYV
ncbi:Pvrl3 [Columba guinea]|nr:Pvrl3 [Columba guinea]